MEKFATFARIAEIEFSDIVLSTQDLGHKLRIYISDKSFIDFFYTTALKTKRFSIHWEKRHIDNTFYRLDNTPDKSWNKVKTFPIHFHKERYNQVSEPPFSLKNKDTLATFLRKFLGFVKENLRK